MKLTIVIPTYSDGHHGWCDMAAENARVWKEHCDELIISEDGLYCEKLHHLADVYVMHPRLWVADNINLGWEIALARGADYVLLMDSDVKYFYGDVRELCIPGAIGVPAVIQHPDSVSVAPMLCVPKEVTAKMGMYDSQNGKHGLYHFDADFQARTAYHQISVIGIKSVRIDHAGGATTSQILDRPCGHEH
jgi:hypothetical protein